MPQDTQRRRSGGGGSRRGGGRSAANRSSSNRTNGATSASKTKPSHIKPLTPTLDPPNIESFTEFALEPAIQKAIADMGITKPTPIQALAIAPVLAGKDIIAKAETGTGKTLAFGAPMISKIDPSRASVLGLVLSPTRELAEQVHDVLEKLGAAKGIKTALVVGGEQMGPQVKKLQAGAQVVVGTPGRVLDLLNQRFLQFPWTEFAVLDEADKMLEIGFIDDVKKILDACNEYRQTLLFSATFPTPLLELARGYTNDPVEVATSMGVSTVDTINQYVLRCSEENRARELAHMIEGSAPDDVFLVFCERRTDVDQLMRQLERRRFSVKALHGGYDQAARFRVMGAFRTGEVKCLVATDVASRGLDVKHVTHVVNLGIPRDVSDYTHRIGRTGRAGAQGVAVTFIARKDERGYRELLETSGFDIEEIERPRDIFARERDATRVREEAKAAAEGASANGATADESPRARRTRGRGARSVEDAAPEEAPRREREAEEAPRRERTRPERSRSESPRGESDAAPDRTRTERSSTERSSTERSSTERSSTERRPRRAEVDALDVDAVRAEDAPARPQREPRAESRAEARPESRAEARTEPRAEDEERPRRRRRGARTSSEDEVPTFRTAELATAAEADAAPRETRTREPRAKADAPGRRSCRPIDAEHPDAPTTDRNYEPRDEAPRGRRRPLRDAEAPASETVTEPAAATVDGDAPERRPRRGRDAERSAARNIDEDRGSARAPRAAAEADAPEHTRAPRARREREEPRPEPRKESRAELQREPQRESRSEPRAEGAEPVADPTPRAPKAGREASAATGFGLGVEAEEAAERSRRGRRERGPRGGSEPRDDDSRGGKDAPRKERAPAAPKAEAPPRDERPERDGKERSKGPKRRATGENPRSESHPPRPSGFGQGI